MSDFMKIHPVGAELFRAIGRSDGRTDRRENMTKLIVAFRNFANAPPQKNEAVGFILVRREEVNSCTRLWTATS